MRNVFAHKAINMVSQLGNHVYGVTMRGVRKKSANCWQARCRSKFLGNFKTEAEATLAYQNARKIIEQELASKSGCSVDGCSRRSRLNGMCRMHALRKKRTGTTLRYGGVDRVALFWKSYSIDEKGCWNWQGNIGKNGYGRFSLNGKQLTTHRLSWTLTHGKIPPGMCVCHKCDNRACINPEHFFLGSQSDNQQDRKEKGRVAITRAKLQAEQVKEIYLSHESGYVLSKRFNISRAQIYAIKNNREWVHVTKHINSCD